MDSVVSHDRPLDTAQTSAMLAEMGFPLAPSTLEHKRVQGGGPEFIKFGRKVLYRPSAIRAWLAAQTRTLNNTAELEAA